MDKTAGGARRRQLLAAVSVLGVSLGMAGVAQAAPDGASQTQSSLKDQAAQKSVKLDHQASIKLGAGQQDSLKGQSSLKLQDQSSLKAPDQTSQKGSTDGGTSQQKTTPWQ